MCGQKVRPEISGPGHHRRVGIPPQKKLLFLLKLYVCGILYINATSTLNTLKLSLGITVQQFNEFDSPTWSTLKPLCVLCASW